MAQFGNQYYNAPPGYRLVPDSNYQVGYTPPPDWGNAYSRKSSIPGRVVSTPDEIRPNEVPSDGTAAFFPARDFSKVYAKQITSDGTIAQAVYVLEQTQEVTKPSVQNEILEPLNKRLDEIEKAIASLRQIWEPADEKKGD